MNMPQIPLDQLESHPDNANRMPPALLAKLRAHIKKSGEYPPLIVRRVGVSSDAKGGGASEGEIAEPHDSPLVRMNRGTHGRGENDVGGEKQAARYQILDGHHRA